jgi:hypothetical protein
VSLPLIGIRRLRASLPYRRAKFSFHDRETHPLPFCQGENASFPNAR